MFLSDTQVSRHEEAGGPFSGCSCMASCRVDPKSLNHSLSVSSFILRLQNYSDSAAILKKEATEVISSPYHRIVLPLRH